MKAERGEGEFTPIVITLETEEEAKLLWDLLHCPSNELGALLQDEILLDLALNMFYTLDWVYTPKEKDC